MIHYREIWVAARKAGADLRRCSMGDECAADTSAQIAKTVQLPLKFTSKGNKAFSAQ